MQRECKVEAAGAALLRAWLDESGRKSAWLADRLGVDASLVSHWTAGRRVPSVEQAGALAALSSGLVPEGSWI
ncbi:MAG: helix-turn-helix transcriptional regulator [Gammaproteobacteria bacterium]|nr:helix-turn-helix transcriptional regulator [Gammaproteobacteria bacterium]